MPKLFLCEYLCRSMGFCDLIHKYNKLNDNLSCYCSPGVFLDTVSIEDVNFSKSLII